MIDERALSIRVQVRFRLFSANNQMQRKSFHFMQFHQHFADGDQSQNHDSLSGTLSLESRFDQCVRVDFHAFEKATDIVSAKLYVFGKS